MLKLLHALFCNTDCDMLMFTLLTRVLSRSNWLAVTDTLSFAEPLSKRVITPSEQNALQSISTDVQTTDSYTNGNFTNRIAVNDEEYHSRAYKRSKRSCSYIVQYSVPGNSEYQYGEIQEFAIIGNLYVAFLKCYPQIVTNICINDVPAPEDDILRNFSSSNKLGIQHVSVDSCGNSALEAVLCENILAKCIAVEANEPFVQFYITPVIDVNCT